MDPFYFLKRLNKILSIIIMAKGYVTSSITLYVVYKKNYNIFFKILSKIFYRNKYSIVRNFNLSSISINFL